MLGSSFWLVGFSDLPVLPTGLDRGFLVEVYYPKHHQLGSIYLGNPCYTLLSDIMTSVLKVLHILCAPPGISLESVGCKKKLLIHQIVHFCFSLHLLYTC